MPQAPSDFTKPINHLEQKLDTTFQKKIYRVVSYNEVGDPGNVKDAYGLSLANDGKPNNASGYSFGWMQWDLHQQGLQSPSGNILKDAVKNINNEALKERAQARGITQIENATPDNVADFKTEISKKVVGTTGKSDPTVTAFKDLIDAELAKMSDKIDEASVKYIKYLDTFTKATINRVTKETSITFITGNEVAQLFIADFTNQFGEQKIPDLVNLLNNGQATLYEKKRIENKPTLVAFATVTICGTEFGIEELLIFSLSTPYGSTHPYDVLRRFGNIVKIVTVEKVFLSKEDATFFADELPKSLSTKDAYNKAFLRHKEFRDLVVKACQTIGKEPPALLVAKPRTNKKKVNKKADNGLNHPHAAETSAWYQQDYYNTKHWNIASRLYHLNHHDDSHDG